MAGNLKNKQECEKGQEILQLEIESRILHKINDFLTKFVNTKPTDIPKPIPSQKLDEFLNPLEIEFI